MFWLKLRLIQIIFLIPILLMMLFLMREEAVIAEEEEKILGMASVSFNLALRYNGEYCQLEELVVHEKARGKNVGLSINRRNSQIG